MATSAPRCAPNAVSAACCKRMSSDSLRLLPDVGSVRDSVRTARPAGVHLDFLHAGRAVQLALVGQLEADLADVVGALVVGGLVPVVDPVDIAIVDAADVADDDATPFRRTGTGETAAP